MRYSLPQDSEIHVTASTLTLKSELTVQGNLTLFTPCKCAPPNKWSLLQSLGFKDETQIKDWSFAAQVSLASGVDFSR